MVRGLVLAAAVFWVSQVLAAPPSLPSTFQSRLVDVGGASIFVQVGGSGSPVVLLHGYVESGDMWGPLAKELASSHTVIVPDLRGLGRSSRPGGGYDKKTEAQDIHSVVTDLGFDEVAIVGHDLGGIVAYAYAAQYPGKVTRLVFMEAPIPGVGPWTEVATMPALWHWYFGGPDAERLVAGRERIYFDHFWRFAADPSRIDDETRDHFASQYATPGAMRAGFAQFAAFAQDARDNQILGREQLTVPVLAIGGEAAFGSYPAAFMRAVASDVRGVVLPDTGHWLMEERPDVVVPLIRDFIDAGARQ
ncbi:alpha/beta fold hydrolase [Inquilinus sp. OTU3971]|uniref:alpha/beta fold hydrolase n=1 Tax=Inquilinus sp. OTU3971 TaxID=3043855 RepID=UPI00313AB864